MQVREYTKSATSVYIKCHAAACELGYKILMEDVSSGIIDFKIGGSLFSFGEDFRVNILSENKNITKVEVSSRSAVSLQLFDWGKNKENIERYFETVEKLLNE